MNLPDRLHAAPAPAPYERLGPSLRPPAPQPTLGDALRRIWRQRALLFWGTAVSAVLGVVVAISIPPRYEAESQVLVTVPQGPKMFKDDLDTPTSPAGAADSESHVQSERYVAVSRLVAQQVVDQLHLDKDPEFNPALRPSGFSLNGLIDSIAGSRVGAMFAPTPASGTAGPAVPAADVWTSPAEARVIDSLISKLDVSVMGRSDVLSIVAHAREAGRAAAVANALADAYLALQRNVKVHDTGRVEQFMQARIDDLRHQVEASEQAVEDYRTKYGLYVGETSGVASQQLTEMNTQLTDAQTVKAEADAKLAEAMTVQKQGLEGDSVPAVLASPLIQALKEQDAEAERHLAELSANYGDKHPEVINAKAQIRDIQRKIRVEMSGIIAGLQHEAKTADAHYATLTHDFNQTQTHLGGVNEKTIHLESLERDATVYRNLLESMLNHEKEISWQRELEQSDARMISPATVPTGPSFPPKTLIFLLVTMAGSIASMLMALARDGSDGTFRRYEDVETATGLPVIALVPQQRGVSPAAQVLKKPMSPYSEALRRIHIGIQMLEIDHSPKSVLFCSATPAEGKSVMIASLGRLLASNGKRVLLIDCDWRSPSLNRIFRLPNSGGLASLLTEDKVVLEDCIRRDAHSGLDVITAGEWSPQKVQALTGERMRQLLRTFSDNYDLVLLDVAPVLVGAEVLMLSRMVDKVMFTVRWGHTRRDAVFEALRQLIDARGDLAGIILSRVDPKRYRQFASGPLNYGYERPAAGQFG